MTLAARIAALLALILALLAGAWRIHVKADAAGYARAQGEYAQQALRQSELRRAREAELYNQAQEIDRAHQRDKERLRADAAAVAERLRDYESTAAAASAAASDTTAAGRAADPWPRIARQCAAALAELDGHAQSLAGRFKALQDYTRRVCVSPAAPD